MPKQFGVVFSVLKRNKHIQTNMHIIYSVYIYICTYLEPLGDLYLLKVNP